jgi:CTP:molybdopterin cytidylyltransferase MocA
VILDGERLVDRAVRTLREGGCDEVLVVLGAWVGDVPNAEIVVNDDWREGMGSSLRVALAALADTDADAAVVTLVDLPGLTPAAVRRLVESGAELAAGAYHGERGHPVLFARGHWSGVVASARGDVGARDYLRDHKAELQIIEVGDVASGEDMDVPRIK